MEDFTRILKYSMKLLKKKNINFKKLIKRNFKSNVNQNLLDNYLNKNIKYFNKLDLNDFWDINFFLERE